MADPVEFLSRTGFRRVTATTNANLTGPITSVGNVTSVSNSINLPGSPTTTTQAQGDNSVAVATTAYVDLAVLDSRPPYFIPFGESTYVPVNKQMANFGELSIEGTLLVDGQFFAEA